MILKIKKQYLIIFIFTLLIFSAFLRFVPFAAKAEETDGIKVPIIMYHQITKKPSKTGKYTVLYSQFKEDMEYIKSKGYETINITDLINYVNGKKSLPKKPIIITFDDGFESIYVYAYPLLDAMNMCGVASIVGEFTTFFTENPDHNVAYSYMDWHQIKNLVNSDVIEIQNHSYDMHKNHTERHGISKMNKEDVATYNTEVGSDIEKMQNMMEQKTGYKPNTLTFPFGAYKKETISLAKSLGFDAALLCEERINIIKQGDTEKLYHLGRYNRPSNVSTEKFFQNILEN